MKKVAWGSSKLLKMYLYENKSHPFIYCIDDYTNISQIEGLPVIKSKVLFEEGIDKFLIVVFAVSNESLRSIITQLSSFGLEYKKNYILYSDFLNKTFSEKFLDSFGWEPSQNIYKYSLSYTLNSNRLIHTTILGTWMFLEIMKHTYEVEGSIAEVGAFEAGNSLCALNFASINNIGDKNFYIFDSFEGFPDISEFDPECFKKGDYCTKTLFKEIKNSFAMFPQALVIKGFVPETFYNIPKEEKFSLVFYDCDLYQPALDTFEFFWEKISYGGYLIIHDYKAEKGGFEGVKRATDKFFSGKSIKINAFSENTMAVIKRQ